MSAGWMIQFRTSAFLLIVLAAVLCPLLLSADDTTSAKEPEQDSEQVKETPDEPRATRSDSGYGLTYQAR